MTEFSREDLLRAEVLAEFASTTGGLEFGTMPGRDRPTRGTKRRRREALDLRLKVEKAQRHEERKRDVRKCLGCDKPVRPVPGRRGPRPKWCSSTCYDREYARARATSCGRPWKLVCPAGGCGKTFEVPRHQHGNVPTYCSRRCQGRESARRRRAQARGELLIAAGWSAIEVAEACDVSLATAEGWIRLATGGLPNSRGTSLLLDSEDLDPTPGAQRPAAAPPRRPARKSWADRRADRLVAALRPAGGARP